MPPSSLEVTFKVNEGPKVKVGNIDIMGNNVFSDRVLKRMNMPFGASLIAVGRKPG